MTNTRSKSIMLAVTLAGAGILAAGADLQAKGGSGEVRIRCNASIRRGPEMGAEWRSIDAGARTRFSVEVADLADAAGLSVQVGSYSAAASPYSACTRRAGGRKSSSSPPRDSS
jgi:hypothetical protein